VVRSVSWCRVTTSYRWRLCSSIVDSLSVLSFFFRFSIFVFSVSVFLRRAMFFPFSLLVFRFIFSGFVRVCFSNSNRIFVHLCVLFFFGVGSGAVWWWVEVLKWWF
jgi:hypothetical protein